MNESFLGRVGSIAFVSVGVAAVSLLSGCARHQEKPTMTAVGLSPTNRCDPPGIPYYLPKPLLVISKNFRHIDESKVGLTGPVPIPNGFDNQAAYGDLKANVTVPSDNATAAAGGATSTTTTYHVDGDIAAPPPSIVQANLVPELAAIDDGAEPDTFFTYEVIFVPDLSQKYGLQISGGAGEFRAAMNLVNGWMYTGTGPFYFKDSSSAQNAMATGVGAMYAGRGAADVIQSAGDLASSLAGRTPEKSPELDPKDAADLAIQLEAFKQIAAMVPKAKKTLRNYAEIYVYEPFLLPDQSTEWRLVAEHHLDRQYFASDTSATDLIRLFGKLADDQTARHPKLDRSNSDDRQKNGDTPPKPETNLKTPGRLGVDRDHAGTTNSKHRGNPFGLKVDNKSAGGDAKTKRQQPVLLPPTVQIDVESGAATGREHPRSSYRKFLDHFKRDAPRLGTAQGDRRLTVGGAEP